MPATAPCAARAQIGADGRDVEGRGEDCSDAARVIEQEHHRRMVHGVIAPGQLHAADDHAETRGERGDRGRCAGEPEKLRVEGMYVAAEHRRSVTLRVDAHEHHAQTGERGALAYLRQLQERRRAHIRTVRKAEEHEGGCARQIVCRELASAGVGEAEVGQDLRLRQPGAACQLRAAVVKLLGHPEAGQRRADGGGEEPAGA
jgi:hypothetical protein